MTRRRWIADEVTGDCAALTGSNASHLARVLRATVGQEFEISTGEEVRLGHVTSVGDSRVEFALGDAIGAVSLRSIRLALAVFKYDRFEWAVEKCTELGVAEIVPVLARRTDTHLASSAAKRVERWQRIAREASQQSRRVSPPSISQPVKVKQFVAEDTSATRILLAETEKETLLRDIAGVAKDVILAVGPEGGWAEEELKMFSDAGWRSASLGRTVLRAETAAIAGVAIIAALSDPQK